jgi:ABC-type branched-subunit amino acid transport system permease subunit
MLDFYFSLPAWLSSVVVIGGCVVLCVGGHLLVRAIIPRRAEKQETELAVALMGVVAAFIGIMLAFAAVQVWDDYNQADHAVAQEAAAISQLYRDLTVYGDETAPSRAAVKTYVRAVLEDEWPRLSHGEPGPKAVAALIQMFNQVGQIRPETNRQTVIYGEVFKKLNEVVSYRRARMITARSELPGLFWMVVVAGSAVIVAFTCVFPATRTNSLIIAGLAVSLGLIFMFILDVNRPFAGAYSVDSKELSDLLPLFDKISGPAL